MNFSIRSASENDAVAVTSVLRRSISELCAADHENDPVRLKEWLSNKTPDNVRNWVAAAGNICLVAGDGERIIGFACATADGEIRLNYVAPEGRFRGVSKALVSALEEKFRSAGLGSARLSSTKTALGFYRSLGYRASGETDRRGALSCEMLVKAL